MDSIPLLMIPAAESRIADAEDWRARMEVERLPYLARQLKKHTPKIKDKPAEEQWHFMDENQREQFLMTWLPGCAGLFDLLADFRFGGYRILSDLICDIDDENTARNRRQLIRDGDSTAFVSLMEAYRNKSGAQTYREAVSAKCRALLDGIVKPVTAVRYVVALGTWDVRYGGTRCGNFGCRCIRPTPRGNGSSVLTQFWPTDWNLVLCG